jgi:hypothetical protein
VIEPGNDVRWVHEHTHEDGDYYKVYLQENKSLESQFEIFLEALQIYDQRNVKYKDNWKRMGWRGMLIRVRERAERLWDDLWDAPGFPDDEAEGVQPLDVDDAIDLINLAAFLIRGVREGNRDGAWW